MAHFFKIVVLGDGGIGKTSICNYLTTGEFFGSYKLSIGADFFSKKLEVDGENITLQITDIGGQDQFAEISNIFTKGAHGALLAYDTTRRDSLDSLDRWINKLEDINIPKVLVSTKNDVEELREVLDHEGVEIAKKYKIPYYIPTSSLKGLGITETFEAISRVMLMDKKGLTLPETQMVDVMSSTAPSIPTVSGSQHIYAQPLGIGRVELEEETTEAPMVQQSLEAPTTPDVQTVMPPTVEPTDAQPSFTKPITLTPPTTPIEKAMQPEWENIEPPTEQEHTITQPITAITPPISEQQAPQVNDKQEEEETKKFSFLDRLNEERKKISDEDEE
ncbi:MAG: Rab family GTPase [Candidatus Heimdallarchaeota archaeon]